MFLLLFKFLIVSFYLKDVLIRELFSKLLLIFKSESCSFCFKCFICVSKFYIIRTHIQFLFYSNLFLRGCFHHGWTIMLTSLQKITHTWKSWGKCFSFGWFFKNLSIFKELVLFCRSYFLWLISHIYITT